MKREVYEILELEVVGFDTEDVIVTSYWGDEDCIGDDEEPADESIG